MAGNLDFKFRAGIDNTVALSGLRELKQEFVSLRDSIKNTISEVKIKITADKSALTQDITSIKSAIKSQIGKIDVDVKVKADTNSITASATTIKNQLKTALGTVDVDLNLRADVAAFTTQASAIRSQINAALGSAVSVHLGIDTAHLRGQLASARTTINNYFNGGLGAIRLTLAITQADIAAARAQLAGLAGSSTKLKLSIDLVHLNIQLTHARAMLNTLIGGGIRINIDATSVNLIATLNSLKASIDQLRASMSGGGGNGGGAGAGANQAGLGGIKSQIMGLLAGFAGLAGFDLFIKTTDQAKQFEGQLRLVTSSTQELIQVQQELMDISATAGTTMSAAVDLYSKLSKSTENLNGGSKELNLSLVDTINKLAVVGGGGTQQVDAGLLQLGQALNSTQVQWEEMSGVMDGTPAIFEAIVKGMGVTRGEFKKLLENGEITPDKIINALLKMSATADEQFAKMPRQAAQSMQALVNEFKSKVTEIDKSLGFSDTFVSGLNSIKANLNEIIEYATALGVGTGITLFARQILIARDALVAKVTALIAARNAEVQRTQVELNAARVTAAAATQELRLAEAHALASAGSTAAAAAQARLTAARIADIQATRALAAAQLAANGAMTAGMGVGRMLLGMLGGPVGLVLTIAAVASGFLMMRDNGNEANAVLEKMGNTADETRKKLEGMTLAQAKSLKLEAEQAYSTAYQETEKASSKILRPLMSAIYDATGKTATKEQQDFGMAAARGQKTGTQIIDFAKAAGVTGEALDNLIRLAADIDTSLKTEAVRQKQVKVINEGIAQKGNPQPVGTVTQRAATAKIDSMEREKIRLQAAIDADSELTGQKRKNIIALGDLEIKMLEREKAKNQSDAAELGKIDNQIYAQKLANQQSLSDFDKQASDKKRDQDIALNDALFHAEKAKIDYKLQQLQNQYDAEEISLIDLYTKKVELTQRLHNLELANFDARINKETDSYKQSILKREREAKRIALNSAGSALEGEAQKAFRKLADDVSKAQKDILDDLDGYDKEVFNAGMSALDKQLADVDKSFKQAEQKIQDLEKRLAKEGNLTVHLVDGSEIIVSKGVLDAYRARIEQQKIELKAIATLKAKPEEIAKRTSDTLDFQKNQESALERARTKKPWDSLMIDQSINQTRQKAMLELKQQLAELEPLANSGLEGIDQQIRTLKESIAELGETIPTVFQEFSLNIRQTSMDAFQSGLSGFFTDITTGAQSIGDAARNMARNFTSALAQMAAQALAKMAIFALLNAITGGVGGATAGAAGGLNKSGLQSAISAGVHHTGGIAGAGGTRRTVDPSAFLSAPRYHVGGISGLAPGEVPAILQPGEEVLTRDNPRHIANGGGQQAASGIKIINAIDGSAILDHVASSEGEKVIMNIISRNASSIRANLDG